LLWGIQRHDGKNQVNLKKGFRFRHLSSFPLWHFDSFFRVKLGLMFWLFFNPLTLWRSSIFCRLPSKLSSEKVGLPYTDKKYSLWLGNFFLEKGSFEDPFVKVKKLENKNIFECSGIKFILNHSFLIWIPNRDKSNPPLNRRKYFEKQHSNHTLSDFLFCFFLENYQMKHWELLIKQKDRGIFCCWKFAILQIFE